MMRTKTIWKECEQDHSDVVLMPVSMRQGVRLEGSSTAAAIAILDLLSPLQDQTVSGNRSLMARRKV